MTDLRTGTEREADQQAELARKARPQLITGDRLFVLLRAAGVIDDLTTRVVIDIGVDLIPKVYTERVGDSRLITVIEALTDLDVRQEDAREG